MDNKNSVLNTRTKQIPISPNNAASRNKAIFHANELGRSFQGKIRTEAQVVSALDAKINAMLNILYGSNNRIAIPKTKKK